MAQLPYPVLLFFYAMFVLSVALIVIGLKLRGSAFMSRWVGLVWAILCVLPFFATFAYTHSFRTPPVEASATPTL